MEGSILKDFFKNEADRLQFKLYKILVKQFQLPVGEFLVKEILGNEVDRLQFRLYKTLVH